MVDVHLTCSVSFLQDDLSQSGAVVIIHRHLLSVIVRSCLEMSCSDIDGYEMFTFVSLLYILK